MRRGKSRFHRLLEQVPKELLDSWTKQALHSEQNTLKQQMKEFDDIDFTYDEGQPNTLRYIGGVDISADKRNPNIACASLVVLTYPDMREVYNDTIKVQIDVPYVPSYLAFREVPYILKLMRRNTSPYIPQVVMVDGNGTLHTRRFGLACHLGVLLDIPCIGVSKTMFAVDGLTKFRAQEMFEETRQAGEWVELIGNSGQSWGAAFRSTDYIKNPIFISSGHRLSLYTAIEIVWRCCRQRVPEPTRLADKLSRAAIFNKNLQLEVN